MNDQVEAFETLLKIAGGVTATIAGVVSLVKNYRESKPALRQSLKTDLELLKLVEAWPANHALIKKRVDATVLRLYGGREESDGPSRLRVYNPGLLLFGILIFLGFGYWTYALVADKSSWWWIALTGFFAFGGLGNAMTSFEPTSAKARRREGTPAESEPASGASEPQ